MEAHELHNGISQHLPTTTAVWTVTVHESTYHVIYHLKKCDRNAASFVMTKIDRSHNTLPNVNTFSRKTIINNIDKLFHVTLF